MRGTPAGAIVGALLAVAAATGTGTGTQEAAVARMRFLVGTEEWPIAPLRIPSVDAETGEAMIWDRHGIASLPEALAASTAFPATAPPITINGRRYMDGALRAGANADLAGDTDVVIMAEPMAHVFGPSNAAAGAGAVVRSVWLRWWPHEDLRSPPPSRSWSRNALVTVMAPSDLLILHQALPSDFEAMTLARFGRPIPEA